MDSARESAVARVDEDAELRDDVDFICPDCLRRLRCTVGLERDLLVVRGECPKHGRFRIPRAARCPQCGYRLEGRAVAGPCPECGGTSTLMQRAVGDTPRPSLRHAIRLLWPVALGVAALLGRELLGIGIEPLLLVAAFGAISGVNGGVQLAIAEVARAGDLPPREAVRERRGGLVRAVGLGVIGGAAAMGALFVCAVFIDALI